MDCSRYKGGYYVAVFNLGDKDSDISIPLADLEIYDGVNGTELWSGERTLGRAKDGALSVVD